MNSFQLARIGGIRHQDGRFIRFQRLIAAGARALGVARPLWSVSELLKYGDDLTTLGTAEHVVKHPGDSARPQIAPNCRG